VDNYLGFGTGRRIPTRWATSRRSRSDKPIANIFDDISDIEEINKETTGTKTIEFKLYKASRISINDGDINKEHYKKEEEPFLASEDTNSYTWDGMEWY
jgi:hypothetical protein